MSAAPTGPSRVMLATESPGVMSATESPRVMVVWCPDWPVVAAAAEHDLPPDIPAVVLEAGAVHTCSAAARADGVRRGMRKRDAQARCPGLVVLDRSPELEVRAFEAVLTAVEALASRVAPIRPGLCTLGVPSRFYGGEVQAAAVAAERVVEAGIWDCRIGIADGIFAAEQAARQATRQDCRVVPPGGSAAFLSGLGVSVLDDPELVGLLRRLGIRSLGAFAQLAPRDVLTRFGQPGQWWHRLARGADPRRAASRSAPLELTQQVEFAPPLETIEPIAFSSRRTAERFVAELARHGLVCSTVRVEIEGDLGWSAARTWAHPRWFAATDLVDRIYWQLQAAPAPEPVCEVRLVPVTVESLGDHGEGLWGSAPDERIERGVARLQGMLGPEAVLRASVQGGHTAARRQALTPWGERATGVRPRGLPWPGSIPPPAPTRVFAEPQPARMVAADGQPVAVTERGGLTGLPHRFCPTGTGPLLTVEAWAGPWPIDELWWDPAGARQVARFQVVGVDGSAWLLVVENGQWWAEARYD